MLLGLDLTFHKEPDRDTLRCGFLKVQAAHVPDWDVAVWAITVTGIALDGRPWLQLRGLYGQMVLLCLLHRPAASIRVDSPRPFPDWSVQSLHLDQSGHLLGPRLSALQGQRPRIGSRDPPKSFKRRWLFRHISEHFLQPSLAIWDPYWYDGTSWRK